MNYKELKADYQSTLKKIIKTKLSTNKVTLKAYKIETIEKYNKIVHYFRHNLDNYTEETKIIAIREDEYCRDKLQLCFLKLNCIYEFAEEQFEIVDETKVTDPIHDIVTNNSADTNLTPSTSGTATPELEEDLGLLDEMAISNLEFLRLCGETIPNAFSGEPLQLQAFINSIELLLNIAKTQTDLPDLLISFIKTRLSGKALECLSDADDSIEKIKVSLKANIKPENEKVIKGKLSALRADRNSLNEFSKQTEALADSLKRALVLDGIPASCLHGD